MNLKRELLNEIKQEIKSSRNPQGEALALVANASEAQNKFDKALKKPLTSNGPQDRSTKVAEVPASRNQADAPDHKRVKFLDDKLASTELQNTKKKTAAVPKKPAQKENVEARQVRPQPQNSDVRRHRQPENQSEDKTHSVEKPRHRHSEDQPRHRHSEHHHSEDQPRHRHSEDELRHSEDEHRRHRRHRHHHHPRQGDQTLLLNTIEEHLITIRKLDLNQQVLKSALQQQEEENKRLKNEIEQLNTQLKSEDQQRSTQLIALRAELFQLKESTQSQHLKLIEVTHQKSFFERQQASLMAQIEHYQSREIEQEQIVSQLKSQSDQYQLKLLDREGQCARLEQQLQHASQNVSLFTSQANEANNQSRTLIQQGNSVFPLSTVTQLQNEKVRLTSEVQILRIEQQESQNSIKDRLNKLKHDNESLVHEHKRELETLETVRRERDQYKHDCGELRVNVHEVEELRRRLHLKDAELEQLQADNDKLKWKVRKDPNGVLSDLKTMPITVYENRVNNREGELLSEIDKLKSDRRHIEDENERLKQENRKLLQSLEQSDLAMGELKSMFARERNHLEDQLYSRRQQPQVAPKSELLNPLKPQQQPPQPPKHHPQPNKPHQPHQPNQPTQSYPLSHPPYPDYEYQDRREPPPKAERRVQFNDQVQQEVYRSPYEMPQLNHPGNSQFQYR